MATALLLLWLSWVFSSAATSSYDNGVGILQAPTVRLVGGDTNSTSISGRLEVFHNNRWGTVCDNEFGIQEARVVCDMLGYSSGSSQCCAAYGQGSGRIWLADLRCNGRETDITQCQHRSWGYHYCRRTEDVGVICTAPINIRLVGGDTTSNTTSGRLEVLHDNVWGTVCDDEFGDNDATVVCRMLGFSSGRSHCCAAYGPGSGTIWLDDVGCNGRESYITQCQRNAWGDHNCVHREDVGVICTDPVETTHSTTDSTTTHSRAPEETTDVPTTIGAVETTHSITDSTTTHSRATEATTDIPTATASNIRLIGGDATSNSTSGRLEVLHDNVWGTVCDDGFGETDARVVCKMLGYSSGTQRCCARYGRGSGTIWLDNMGCDGAESDIIQCQHNGWGNHNCGHSEDVGVICSSPVETTHSTTSNSRATEATTDVSTTTASNIRLIGGDATSNSTSGRLEVFHDNVWGTVCDDGFGETDARVVCKMLGYSSGTQRCCAGYGRGSGTIWLDNMGCNGAESDIIQCQHNGWGNHNCGHREDVGVICSRPVETTHSITDSTTTDSRATEATTDVSTTTASNIRLIGGDATSNSTSGRLEVFHDNVWGTVCDDSFGEIDARVVCRMLGYSSGTQQCCAGYGQGSGRIWLDNMRCNGSESDIIQCQHNGWGNHNCGHHEDVGVICTAPFSIRLVGGDTTSNPKSGRLEVLHDNVWGTVCDDQFGDNDATVVCRMLGFSSGRSRCCAGYGRGSGKIWLDNMRCNGAESDIIQCQHNAWGIHDCSHSEDVGVICSHGL